MDKYTRLVKRQIGGIDPDVWFDIYYRKNEGRDGKETIVIIDKNGKKKESALRDAAIMLRV